MEFKPLQTSQHATDVARLKSVVTQPERPKDINSISELAFRLVEEADRCVSPSGCSRPYRTFRRRDAHRESRSCHKSAGPTLVSALSISKQSGHPETPGPDAKLRRCRPYGQDSLGVHFRRLSDIAYRLCYSTRRDMPHGFLLKRTSNGRRMTTVHYGSLLPASSLFSLRAPLMACSRI